MKTRFLLALTLLLAGFADTCFAQQAAEPPPKGTVLLLKNDRVMEGDILRVGDRYRIRRGESETMVSGDLVVALMVDRDELHTFKLSRINSEDPDERLKLAKWCRLNGMTEAALAEARAAAELRPNHTETKQLVQVLLERTSTASVKAAPHSPQPLPHPGVAEAADINADSLAIFGTRVQPVLMNACGSCHLGGKGREFQLFRSFEGGEKGALRGNLASVLLQLNIEKPALSPLLIKSISAHGGGAEAPLKDRRSQPYRILQDWTALVIDSNPQLRQNLPARWSPPSLGADGKSTPGETAPLTSVKSSSVVSKPLPRMDVKSPSAPSNANPEPPAAPEVVDAGRGGADPFDPAQFNKIADTPR